MILDSIIISLLQVRKMRLRGYFSESRVWDPGLGVGGLFGRWSQEAEWRKREWNREARKDNKLLMFATQHDTSE